MEVVVKGCWMIYIGVYGVGVVVYVLHLAYSTSGRTLTT